MIRYSLEAIRIVVEVVRRGGVNRAAASLNKVPSAITHTIQKLERDLDAKLFEKQGRLLVLTAAGERLVEQGKKLLERALDLETSVRQIANGWDAKLRITISEIVPTDWVLSIIEKLKEISPRTQISLNREVLTGNWDVLITGRTDVVIGAPFDPPLGRGLKATQMGEIEFVCVMAPNHPMASVSEPLDNENYRQHCVITVPDTASSIPQLSIGTFDGQPKLEVPDMETKLRAHLLGLGVGTMPRYMVTDELLSGRLIRKRYHPPHFEPVQLAWRAENTGKVVKWLREEILENPIEWLDQQP